MSWRVDQSRIPSLSRFSRIPKPDPFAQKLEFCRSFSIFIVRILRRFLSRLLRETAILARWSPESPRSTPDRTARPEIMRGAVFPSLLCSFLAVSCAANPIHQVILPRWNLFEQQDAQQHPLAKPIERIPPPQTIPVPRKPYFQFDAAENSVGLLITTHDGEVVHLWVPLGKRVFTRKSPSQVVSILLSLTPLPCR